ncbi:MAG: CPBP family intramembrane glutamic endopeptidase [Maribacter sp.]|uniref:CPBP family intramembrane glutamic endopeptidase n=1 Tax=Maribacter sp. TaxID=1897614 RepID=UPI003C727DE1
MKPVLTVIGLLLLELVLSVALSVVIARFSIDFNISFFLSSLIVGILVLLFFYRTAIFKQTFISKFNFKAILPYILLTLVTAVLTRIILGKPWAYHLPDNLSGFLFTFGLLVLAPFFEELCYRGLAFEYLLKKNISKVLIVIVTTTIFTLGHFPFSNATIGVLLLSLITSVVYLRERNIWYCIGIHFTYNLLML